MMLPTFALTGAVVYLFGRQYMSECDEAIVVALERAGVEVATGDDGVVTLSLATQAIDKLAGAVREALQLRRRCKMLLASTERAEEGERAAKAELSREQEKRSAAETELQRVKAEATKEIARLTDEAQNSAVVLERWRVAKDDVEGVLRKTQNMLAIAEAKLQRRRSKR